MATLLVAFLLTADVGSDVIVQDTVDIIEVNHVYDKQTGRERLSQTIFWEFRPYRGGLRISVVDWRMQDGVRALPRYDHRERVWILVWWDSKHKVLRRVLAASFRETHTRYDPEVDDQDKLSTEYRRGLSRSP